MRILNVRKSLCGVVFLLVSASAATAQSASSAQETRALSELFPNETPSVLSTFSNANSLTGDAKYKNLLNLCRGYSNDPACAGLAVFGTVNRSNAPDSIRGMNRMVVLSPSGQKRFQDIGISGGSVSYDPTSVRENEVGFINISYYKGSAAMPFNRCDAEIIVCGSKVLGCPHAAKTAVCSPVVSNVSTNTNCSCSGGKILTSCIGNIPKCIDPPTPVNVCATDEVFDGNVCKKKWSCNFSDLTPTEQNALSEGCFNTTVTLDRGGQPYFPSSLYCSGKKDCTPAECPAGNMLANGVCTQCEAGTFSPAANSTYCAKCDGGKVAPEKGLAACSACSPGEFSTNGITCTPCGSGTYIEAGVCKACPTPNIPGASGFDTTSPPGTTDPAACVSVLKGCIAGYTKSPDGKSCDKDPGSPPAMTCEPGLFVSSPTSCESCPGGTYMDTKNTGGFCKDCPKPTIAGANEIAMSSPVGSTASSQCTSTIKSCVAGYTLAADGLSCTQDPNPQPTNTFCGKGQFLASGFCLPCEAGTYMAMDNHTNNTCTSCALALPNGSFYGGMKGATQVFADPANPSTPSCGTPSCGYNYTLDGTGQSQSCRQRSCPFVMVANQNYSAFRGYTDYASVPDSGLAISPFYDHQVPGTISIGGSPYSQNANCSSNGSFSGMSCAPEYSAYKLTCTSGYSWTGWSTNYSGTPNTIDYARDSYGEGSWGSCNTFNGYPCYETCYDKSVTIEGKSLTLPSSAVFNPQMSTRGRGYPDYANGQYNSYYPYAKVAKGGGDRSLCGGKDNGDTCKLDSGNDGKILRVKFMELRPTIQSRYSKGASGGQGYEYRCVWMPNDMGPGGDWTDPPAPTISEFCTCMP